MNPKKTRWLSGPYIVWMALFVIIPLIIVAVYGLTNMDGSFTVQNVLAMGQQVHMKAIWMSVQLALISTIVCLLIAYPLALIIRALKIKSTGFVIFLFILPMWMNFLLRTIAWQSLLEKTGVINSLLKAVGLSPLNMINTEGAIVLGMVYNFLPFMVLPIYNALIKVSDDTLNAARDLGANGVQTFFKITLPLTTPGMISGITMVFVPSLTTFVISDLLGGAKISLIGNVIEQEFTTANDWNLGSGLSLVLMVVIIGSMAIMSGIDKKGEGTTLW